MKFMEPSGEYSRQIQAYRQEFRDCGDSMDGTGGLSQTEDIETWIEQCRLFQDPALVPKGLVPATQYIYVREDDQKIVGMLQIRHELNDYLAKYSGHIGYSVVRSERRKGYASQMLRLALSECRKRGIDRVLVSCGKDNIASRRTILSCGGVYESTVYEPDKKIFLEKYWIDVSE